MGNEAAATDHAYWIRIQDTPASKMTFFDATTTKPHMAEREEYDRTVMPESVRDVDLFEEHHERLSLKVLLNQATDRGCSLVQVTAAPGTVVPRHKHNVDQVVWCVAGSMTQGNKLLQAGTGYFTPADHVYGYEAGPDGVTYIEFRNCPLDDAGTVFVEDNLERWRPASDVQPDRA
jgi:quercetin dioxygenase-like cupin family protein